MDLKKNDFENICRFCLRTNPQMPIFTRTIDEIVKVETDDAYKYFPTIITVLTNLTVCCVL